MKERREQNMLCVFLCLMIAVMLSDAELERVYSNDEHERKAKSMIQKRIVRDNMGLGGS